MDYFYLLEYLKQNTDIDKSKIDLLKYQLDQRIYFFGQHFKYPRENANRFKLFLRNILQDVNAYSLYLTKCISSDSKKRIISNAYFSTNFELEKLNYNVISPIHVKNKANSLVGDFSIYNKFKTVRDVVDKCNFYDLKSDDSLKKIDALFLELYNWYKKSNISSLIVPNDIAFFELLNIRIFKQLQRPSFVFLHGLPCRYNPLDENETDYLIVWGDKIKENYVNAGFCSEKIYISGHPYYNKKIEFKLRNSLDNILILTKSIEGAQHRDKVRLGDRGNIILYLYSIQNVLKRKGVKKVKLRPHPSENVNWYLEFLDTDFFELDKLNLSDSLKQSTLVIGPASTVFLESLYFGVNYVVYEPTINHVDLVGFIPAPPFDGNNSKVPVAKDENDLFVLINDKLSVDSSIFNDYIQTPFDMGFIKKLI
ncbi:MAG: hypothetical protein PHR83_14055 [Paludibacter sp.]|nr:hypothetical protein [Paludibacter sp.]